ncbi:hypothetical protein N0V83_003946 [Neocucurbitaria cava]|uniref:DUF7730 domain-containing protein n=1 Tax=Neocucurbitaria cava TaxID=798079 RepID=A0A9W9CNK8_9PLEO|nr:hypothetical protein N0V83_003946 [Neocucurbitaria cava]
MPIAERENALSPLLRLPAELRNQIYEYVLGGKSICLTCCVEVRKRDLKEEGFCTAEIATCVTPPGSGYDGADPEERSTLNIVKVCRQIHAETRLLIFSLNIFRYSRPVPNLDVWRQRRPECLSLITSVRLYSDARSDEAVWLDGLKYFLGLKRLEVAVHYPYVSNVPRGQQQVETKGLAARDAWEFGVVQRARQNSNWQVQVIFYHRWRS